MNKKIKVIRQNILLKTPEGSVDVKLISLFIEYFQEWDLVSTVFEKETREKSLSVFIAENLYDFGESNLSINHSSRSLYLDVTTIESRYDYEFESIEIIKDSSYGNIRGFSDADTIYDWKVLGYDLEIIDYEE